MSYSDCAHQACWTIALAAHLHHVASNDVPIIPRPSETVDGKTGKLANVGR
jgi:hypothetical protein